MIKKNNKKILALSYICAQVIESVFGSTVAKVDGGMFHVFYDRDREKIT